MASEKILAAKQEEVKSLAESLKTAQLVLLVDYRGITVDEVTKLRNELRDTKAEYKVIKNNIIKRAIETARKIGRIETEKDIFKAQPTEYCVAPEGASKQEQEQA